MRTLFYRIPRLAALALLVAIAGAIGAILTLGRQEDPTLVKRFGYVLTTFPGANAERIEALVTDPLEKRLLELVEVEETESTSRENVSQIMINVDEALTETEVDNAWNLIRSQVQLATTELPPGAGTPFVKRLSVGASSMTISLTWSAETEPQLAVMARLAGDLEDRLRGVPGTEETNIYGLPDEEIRIVVDPDALAAAGLNTRQAAELIAAADSKSPAGRVRAGESNVSLEVGGAFESVQRIRSVPLLQNRDGSSLRVGDVAEVSKGIANPQTKLSFHNGERTVMVDAWIQPNLRVDQWAELARAQVEAFAAMTPGTVDVNIVFEQDKYTGQRLGDLTRNLVISAGIVFLVLFVIMGWRAAFVVGLALPLTVCLVLILFNVFKVPLHQMSVTGLVISLGLLIDNAIVVVDEYDQMRTKGMGVRESIDHVIGHLFAPLLASTLTTALAFAPIALLSGSAGEFIGMIGLSVIFSVVSSFAISMTVIPAIAGWMDRPRQPSERKLWWRDGVAIDAISDGYRWTIGAVLAFPPLGIAVGIIPAFIGFILGGSQPVEFFPQTERDQFQLELTLQPNASVEQTQAVTHAISERLLIEDGVESVTWTLGEPGPRVYYNIINNTQDNEGFAGGWVTMESAAKARSFVKEAQALLREEFPNARILALPFQQGPPTAAPIEFSIRGDDLSTLNALGNETRRILAGTPGVTYTVSSLSLGAPTVTLQADESATAIAGQRLTQLAGDLNAELEGVIAGSVLEGVKEIPIRVIAPENRRGTLSEIGSKTIGGAAGAPGAPVSALGDLSLDPTVASISRLNGRRVNTVFGFLEPYSLAAPSAAAYQVRLEESGFQLPTGYTFVTGGESETRGETIANLASTAVPLLLMIAGCVTLVFNSFRLGALVLTTGYLSVGLAFFGIWLFNLPLGFTAIVGAIGLVGIAINGSIVVLSQLRSDPASMAGDRLAQREVVVDATRHIVATTLTTMGSFMPLILTGDAFWMPLAAGISVGVAGSAILALYFTPAVFRLLTVQDAKRAQAEPLEDNDVLA